MAIALVCHSPSNGYTSSQLGQGEQMSRIRRTTTIVAATLLSVVALGALAPSADAAAPAKPSKAILKAIL
jgi:hypothetical protein